MAQLRVRVGAALDPSALTIFRPLIAQAKDARAKIAAEGKAAGKEYVGGYRDAPAHAKRGFDGVAKAAEGADKAVVASAKKAAKEQEQAAEHVYQIKRRYMEQVERDEQRAASRQLKLQQNAARSVVSGAARSFGGVVRSGIGVAGQIARGVGVDLDAGSLVGKVTNQQAAATQIANSGYLEGEKGAAGVRQDPAKILAEARAAADVARISTDTALEGLQSFVGKTTDLETGRALLEKMAVLSKSTGANMADVMDAAGSLSVKMGDVPDKANAVAALMGVIAKQGKIGATEMRSMAAQMAGFTGPANKFAEGTGKAVVELGTLFQVLSKSGFAKSAAQASTSVGSFVGDLTSKAGLKSLRAAGVKDEDLFADKGKTKLNSLESIIPKLLEKTGGDLTKLSAEITNKRSKAVLDAFAQIYNTAEGQKKGSGSAAVKAKFAEYAGGTSAADTAGALAAANATDASKVQLFNNAMERVAEESAGKVLPAMEKLAPAVITAAEYLGKFAGFAAENPGKTLALALGASVAKEMASAGLKAVFEKALTSGLSGSMGGALGLTLTVAAATIAITEATFAAKERAAEGTQEAAVAAGNAASSLRAGRERGTIGSDELKAAEDERNALRAKIAASAPEDSAFGGSPAMALAGILGKGITNFATGGAYGESFGSQEQKASDLEQSALLKEQLANLDKQMGNVHKAIASGTLKVVVVNMPGGALPGPVPSARTGP